MIVIAPVAAEVTNVSAVLDGFILRLSQDQDPPKVGIMVSADGITGLVKRVVNIGATEMWLVFLDRVSEVSPQYYVQRGA